MILKKIDEKTYEKFVSSSNLSSFYQSVEWYHLKLDEGKHCELLGLYEEDNLVGVSLIIYVKVLKKYYKHFLIPDSYADIFLQAHYLN